MRHCGLVLSCWLATAACERPEGTPGRVAETPRSAPRARAIERPAANESAAAQPSGRGSAAASAAFGERRAARDELAREVEAGGIRDSRVLTALRRVPRHAFVPAELAGSAYANRPLPIGEGQTISQPTVVAAMTEAGAARPSDKCLEIGTGSGYQAAILAEVCAEVYSIEYHAPLAERARRVLRELGYDERRVKLRTGDGYVGWPEAAPFDVILVTAAPESVPTPLLEQLAQGGRLVVPVGPQHEIQYLELHRRIAPGSGPQSFEKKSLMPVRFVPFLGDGATRDAPPKR